MDIISEIFELMLNSVYKFCFIGNVNHHPNDIVRNYFVLEHSKFIKYDDDIFDNDEQFFNWYNTYFEQSCTYLGESRYKMTLTLLIKHYSKKHILQLHNNVMDYFKNEVYKQTKLSKEHFNYLTDSYDTVFKRRLTDEINNIMFTVSLMWDSLDKEAIDEIKEEYEFIKFEF